MTGRLSFTRGNALTLPLADQSVALIVTSPPYFNLRSYRDGGEHFGGQLGSEPTPFLFLANLWLVMDEAWRVLRDDGNCWLNLGDKFAQSPGQYGMGHASGSIRRTAATNDSAGGLRAKTRMALPHRFYEGCIDPEYRAFTEQRAGFDRAETERRLILAPADGGYPQWVGRLDVVWAKANGMPSSAQDRCRDSHEYWFHLVKSNSYFSALDAIRGVLDGGVESEPECFPLCTLCGGPPDPLSSLIGGGHELHGGVVPVGVAHEVGTDQRIELQGASRADYEDVSRPRCPPVPLLVDVNLGLVQDSLNLVDDRQAAVVDSNSEIGGLPVTSVAEMDRSFAVDDSSQPGEVCICNCHTRIIQPKLGKPPGSVWEFPSEPLVGVPEFMVLDDPDSLHPSAYLRGEADAWAWVEEQGVDCSVWPRSAGVGPQLYAMPDHFAAFPHTPVKRIILGWSPSGVCVACGDPRRPVAEFRGGQPRSQNDRRSFEKYQRERGVVAGGKAASDRLDYRNPQYAITGYACSCPTPTAPTTPARVLDPFSGTGTTAIVAAALGRHGIGVELSADYLRLARWRDDDGGLRCKALGVERPPKQVRGQEALF